MTRSKIYQESPDGWTLRSSDPSVSNSQPRYVVKKDSGSHWAYLKDTRTGATVCRSNVLGKDAWSNLDKHCARLNERDRLDQALKAV